MRLVRVELHCKGTSCNSVTSVEIDEALVGKRRGVPTLVLCANHVGPELGLLLPLHTPRHTWMQLPTFGVNRIANGRQKVAAAGVKMIVVVITT